MYGNNYRKRSNSTQFIYICQLLYMFRVVFHPKHVKQLTDINKLCTVASFSIIIPIYYAMHGPLKLKFLNVA